MENVRRERRAAFARAHPVRSWIRWGATLLAVLGPFAAVLTVVFGLPSYDDRHPVSVVCTVDQTAVGTSRGRYSHEPYVQFRTSDCGKLDLFDGITDENRGDVAAAIEQGQRYRFTVGGGSWALRDVLRVARIAVEVSEYAPER